MGEIDEEAAKNQEYEAAVASIFHKSHRPVILKFKDVVYKAVSIKKWLFGKEVKQEEKFILKGITGMVLPGEMLAILGPSGSGKTTLLTALGVKLSGNGQLGGTITYNGKPFCNSMKRNIGFVTQDDVFYPHLTVTETLVFTALLRLPNSFTKEQKIMQAEVIINQLGLVKCKNNIIGGPLLRGVSGGERKRVSIGQEMLINPGLLFLDEPTSGLDSTTAQTVVSTVWEQAKEGRAIAMTIHQPSSRLFYMFDKILLLSEGKPLYFGKGTEVMEYFSTIGFAPSNSMNPSEFLLDLANGIALFCGSCDDQTKLKNVLISAYENNLASKLQIEIEAVDDHSFQDGINVNEFSKWPTTWWQQFLILSRRGVKERRHQTFSRLKISQVLMVAFIVGVLWLHTSHLQDQVGLLFFICGFWSIFTLNQAIFSIPKERLMLTKERSSGTYRLSSYFMSRMVGDCPMELILPTTFVTITYWMAGLKATLQNFFHMLCVVLLNVLVSKGLGFALGAMIMNEQNAAILGGGIILASQLASGILVQNIPVFMQWIRYISSSSNTLKLLLGSQYKPSDTYQCGNSVCLIANFPMVKTIGLDGQVHAVVVLVIMLVVYNLIAYLALTRIGRTRN